LPLLRIFLAGNAFDNFVHLVCQSFYLSYNSCMEYYWKMKQNYFYL
jgi:hypothetical protein